MVWQFDLLTHIQLLSMHGETLCCQTRQEQILSSITLTSSWCLFCFLCFCIAFYLWHCTKYHQFLYNEQTKKANLIFFCKNALKTKSRIWKIKRFVRNWHLLLEHEATLDIFRFVDWIINHEKSNLQYFWVHNKIWRHQHGAWVKLIVAVIILYYSNLLAQNILNSIHPSISSTHSMQFRAREYPSGHREKGGVPLDRLPDYNQTSSHFRVA